MDCCDLHTHSVFSDGTVSPAQIVARGLARNLGAVALTDHNTLAGLPEFLEAARGTALEAVPGVEISTGYLGQEVHIVGLYLEAQTWGELEAFLAVINRRKEESNRALTAALCAAGYALCYDELQSRHPGNINRGVIAGELVRKGYVRDIGEAFQGVLSSRNGLYVPPERISAVDAIRFLRRLHAVPVLAHPLISLTQEQLRSFLPLARDQGLAAMETRYASYTPEMTRRAGALARQFGLLESGGSDFHGDNKPGIALGSGTGDLAVPYSFCRELAAWRNGLGYFGKEMVNWGKKREFPH